MTAKSEADQKLHINSTLIGGLLTGACAKFISHPIDTVKARLQISKSVINTKHIVDNNLFNYCIRIIQKEGINGLYPGVGISTIGGAPASMLFWGSFEKSKHFLGRYSVGLFSLKFVGPHNGSVVLFSGYRGDSLVQLVAPD
jgi:hypothetical protein